MMKIEQGDIVRVDRAKVPFLVVSSTFYNQSGMMIVCPIVPTAPEDALHVRLPANEVDGIVLCEQLASVSIRGRGCTVKGRLSGESLPEIIYRVQSIFDYVPYVD